MNTIKKLVYGELSYRLVGLLFSVHKELGGYHQERYYQRAIALALKKQGIIFAQELSADLQFDGQSVGKYRFDFLIEDKIVLELKALPRLRRDDFRRLLAYLKVKGLELGILANFRGDKLKYHRVLNSSAPGYLKRIRDSG